MARAPVLTSDKSDNETPKEVMDAATKLVDEIIEEAETTISKTDKNTTDRRKFQFLTAIKTRAVKWFREHFGTRGWDRSHSRDVQERVQVAK
ncbi:Hypothetical protein NTJ_06899 [Nesidiocoris tenuis]|uniref:Uncharacterized protein n=1 Tax=Nesidiocoris tenuis TaxID=355587 RepID=A0ABN7APE4_9HEMI|nr:Hypothetical protein NTJ_06899 [Nesidiocoris tenuis]